MKWFCTCICTIQGGCRFSCGADLCIICFELKLIVNKVCYFKKCNVRFSHAAFSQTFKTRGFLVSIKLMFLNEFRINGTLISFTNKLMLYCNSEKTDDTKTPSLESQQINESINSTTGNCFALALLSFFRGYSCTLSVKCAWQGLKEKLQNLFCVLSCIKTNVS